eukprot:CAMPEP_0176404932 /NCGR_PEP_ID=MMETSP0127-20121128/71_1 /TAXON_ID=938130 /ORGANISM="Platyophrya macrostoma, Strain WH" /LENGTH=395 /DNA_ID=CAMNT_0017783963 /DNA_START=138 /DNA_END=1325 /DNA_ORIENTATION=-
MSSKFGGKGSAVSTPTATEAAASEGAAASPLAVTTSGPTSGSPRTPTPKVPLLRLAKTSPTVSQTTPKAATPSTRSVVPAAGKPTTQMSPSVSVDRGNSASPNGTVRKLRTGIHVSYKAPSLIFKPADTQPPPTTSAFHANQTHSNPFEADRQITFPPATKRTSITPHRERGASPSIGGVPAGGSPAVTGRRAPPCQAHNTDPIAQTKDDAVARSSARKSVSAARGVGSCAPPAKDAAGSAIEWQPPAVTPLRLGKRCSSAPASVRESSPQEPVVMTGLSTKPNLHKPTLTGVWTAEPRPKRATTPVRAPYAQATPRASTPPATRRPSVAPYATGEPKRTTPTIRKSVEPSAPYHTTTPRAPSPSASYKVRAPFHTSTPRGPTSASRSKLTNNIF